MAMSKSMKLYSMNVRSTLKESIVAEAEKRCSDRDDVYDERAISEGKPGEEFIVQRKDGICYNMCDYSNVVRSR